jgi:hypothetical protein
MFCDENMTLSTPIGAACLMGLTDYGALSNILLIKYYVCFPNTQKPQRMATGKLAANMAAQPIQKAPLGYAIKRNFRFKF